jgi:hypothetical protein
VAVAKPLHLRLFLEGQEVPVIAAQVGINPNAPASASIQVIPLDEVMELKPRTMVHLFFLDTQPKFETDMVGFKKADTLVFRETQKITGQLGDYKLLFSGEVVGFSFVKTPVSRSIVLQCLDHSSYWDACHATAIEYGPHGNAFTEQSAILGSNNALFDDIVNQQAQRLVEWIGQKPQTPGLSKVSGLAGGIIRVLEAMSGVPDAFKGVNDFFTVAQLRCRILEQISAEEGDDTAHRLLAGSVFNQWLMNGLQNIGQQVTFRDIIKLLFNYIYYEVVPNPAAKFDDAFEGKKHATPDKTLDLKQTSAGQKALKGLKEASIGVTASLQRDGETIQKNSGPLIDKLQKIVKDLEALVATTPAARQIVDAVKSDIEAATNTLRGIYTTTPRDGMALSPVKANLDRAIEVLNGNTAKFIQKGGVFEKFSTQRLRSQIIRPDCFFAPPPRCNIIFPEHYTQITYDRVFIQEATRVNLFMYNVLVGPDKLLGTRVLAPTIGENSKILQKSKGKKSYRTLMDHELHTGIILRSESMTNSSAGLARATADEIEGLRHKRLTYGQRIALFHFYKYRYGARQSNLGGRFNPYIVCGFPAVVITSPFIVPGVSQDETGADQETADRVQALARQHGAPTHFLGMVSSLSHSIDQSGGTTSVQMHHVRAHQGTDDEFVHKFGLSTSNQQKRIRVPLVFNKVAENEKLLKILTDVTPQGEPKEKSVVTITQTKDVYLEVDFSKIEPQSGFGDALGRGPDLRSKKSKTKVSKKITKQVEVTKKEDTPDYVTYGTISKVERKNIFVPFGNVKRKAGDKGVYGKIIGVEVVNPSVVPVNGQHAFQSVILHEEVTVPVEGGLPVEEVIRPSWFSPLYSNRNIGPKVYEPNLGCGSIVDQVSFANLGSEDLSSVAAKNPEGLDMAPDKPLEQVIAEVGAIEKQKKFVSVEKAVNLVAYVYGLVKAQQLDVDEFIRSFTYRPIATYRDVLGDVDLEDGIQFNGRSVTLKKVSRKDEKGKAVTEPPFVGFHSMAVSRKVIERNGVGKSPQLTGLLIDPSIPLARINNIGKPEGIVLDYDVRHEKLSAVLKYKYALEAKRAFRG